MKKHFLYCIKVSLCLFLFTSCTQSTYDDIEEEEIIPELVTYQDIKSTIDNACLNCHSNPTQNGAPMSLVTYENVKDAVLNRDLLGRVNKNDGEDGLMPLGGPRLSQDSIDLLFLWEEDGLLEN